MIEAFLATKVNHPRSQCAITGRSSGRRTLGEVLRADVIFCLPCLPAGAFLRGAAGRGRAVGGSLPERAVGAIPQPTGVDLMAVGAAGIPTLHAVAVEADLFGSVKLVRV